MFIEVTMPVFEFGPDKQRKIVSTGPITLNSSTIISVIPISWRDMPEPVQASRITYREGREVNQVRVLESYQETNYMLGAYQSRRKSESGGDAEAARWWDH